MKIAQITQRGRLQIPAEVRRRWGTRRVTIEDAGSYIDIRPVTDTALDRAERQPRP